MALKFVVVALSCSPTWAFCPSVQLRPVSNRGSNAALSMGYIPDGLSADEWKKIQQKEKEKNKVNLGRVGPKGFKSRSFKAWQESGAGHLFPVDPKKVASGEIPLDEVPYMQRGGAWDDSDLSRKKGGILSKKIVAKKWTASDKKYAEGGYKKEQSVSIFGGTSLPWTAPSGKPTSTSKAAVGNKPRVNVQKGMTRPGVNSAASPQAKRNGSKTEGKKGPFGLW